jgi:hypothetical protein
VTELGSNLLTPPAVTTKLESVPRAFNLFELRKADTKATTSAKATSPKPIQSLVKKLRREGSVAAAPPFDPSVIE